MRFSTDVVCLKVEMRAIRKKMKADENNKK